MLAPFTDDKRATVLARHAKDQPMREIAEGTGLSVSTVWKVIHEA